MKRKTLTILIANLQGNTASTASQSGEENKLLIKEFKSFIEKMTAKYNGIFVKAMGDGFLLNFESPADSVACGQDIQVKIKQHNANVLDQDNFIQFRIGINTGEVNIDDDGDVTGDVVNIASHIHNFTELNNVYISEATYLTMNRAEIQVHDLGLKKFMNIPKQVRVYKILKKNMSILALMKKKNVMPRVFFTIGFFNAIILIAFFLIVSRSTEQPPDIEELVAQEDYDAIIQSKAQLLDKDPDNLKHHEMVIKAFIKMQEYDKAEEHLKNVLDFHPEGNSICPVTAEFLGEQGEYQMASDWLQRYCEQEPDDQEDKAIVGKLEVMTEEYQPRPEFRDF